MQFSNKETKFLSPVCIQCNEELQLKEKRGLLFNYTPSKEIRVIFLSKNEEILHAYGSIKYGIRDDVINWPDIKSLKLEFFSPVRKPSKVRLNEERTKWLREKFNFENKKRRKNELKEKIEAKIESLEEDLIIEVESTKKAKLKADIKGEEQKKDHIDKQIQELFKKIFLIVEILEEKNR